MVKSALTVFVQGQGAVSASQLNAFERTTDLVGDLKSFVGIQGVQVYCRGLATVGDGGGGEFYWATGSFTDNGATVIVPNGSGTGAWVKLTDASIVLTIAALRALPATETFAPVFVQGYLTPFDGGEGFFAPNPADTTSTDNGGTIIVAGTTRWCRLFSGPIFPEWFGGFTTDMTAQLNAVLAIGGLIQLSAATYNYTALTANAPFRMSGALQSSGSVATVLNCTAATNTDKIVVGNGLAQLDGCLFEHIVMNAPNATGGAVVFFNRCADSGMTDIQMLTLGSTARGVKGTWCNTIRLNDMRIVNPTVSGVYFYGTDTTRTDIVEVNSLIVSGTATTGAAFLPNAIDLDGFVNTINGKDWYFVACGRGLYCHNSVGATLRGQFVIVHDMQVDFPYYECVRVDYHDSMYFTACYMHGSVTSDNVQINTDTPDTTTNISFIGGNCTGAYKRGMYLNGNYQRVEGVLIGFNSQAGSAAYPGVEIGPNSIGAIVVGNVIGAEAGVAGATHSYGVLIDAGATEYLVTNNDLTGNVTGPLLDTGNAGLTSAAAMTSPNVGQITDQAFVVNSPLTGFSITIGLYQTLILIPAGTLAAGTVVMPVAPVSGQRVSVFTTQAISAMTFTPSAGQTFDTSSVVTALTAKQRVSWVWDGANTLWYRTQ